MITKYDNQEIRCPMLGHPLHFSYCRTTDGTTPCRRIYNCWFERLPIQQFMQDNFSQDVLNAITAPPKPKTVSLFELIEKAKQTKKNGTIPHEDVDP